jgi:lipopolysaccharide/colanic/teichoic acid biosynthesis glycosyltransferase
VLEWPLRQRSAARASLHLVRNELSSWSRSAAKRLFDCASVLAALPLLVPVLMAVAVAVRVTSRGPVLFLQRRHGRHGRLFTIIKFRTIHHDAANHAVSTVDNQPFTPVGPFLRRWKLDELPQVVNVLMGHMSLVGPRPKLPEHMILDLQCRPGITGAATVAFACEDAILDEVPQHSLQSYYHGVVLPAKHKLDAEYMARATFLSDLKLVAQSVLRRWDHSITRRLLDTVAHETTSAH